MSTIVKMQDIAAEATAKVNELLAAGYTFNFTSAGHQGEYFKVDLTRGDETLRVCVEPVYSWADGNDRDLVVLTVARYTICFNTEDHLWNVGMKDTSSGSYPGTVVERHVWYKVGHGRWSGVYTDDLEVIKAGEAVADDRWHARRESGVAYGTRRNEGGISTAFVAAVKPEAILPIVRKHRGYGRATVDDIAFVMRDVNHGSKFIVHFNRQISKTAKLELVLGR